MLDLVLMYKWTIFAGIFSSAALALIGAQLAARNQSVQTLVVSQAASFGVVAGLAVYALLGEDHAHPHDSSGLVPLFIGLLFSGAAYFVCEYLILRRWQSRNTYYIGLFGLLMALTYCVIALVPSLESHMAASYFGDLTVASNAEAQIVGCLSAGALFILFSQWRQITSWSFESMIFGAFVGSKRQNRANRLFTAAALLTISASVQFLGLLFTICCLFLPAMILTQLQRSLRGLALKTGAAAAAATFSGFVLSIAQGSLPTVPTVALMLVFCSLLIGLATRPFAKAES